MGISSYLIGRCGFPGRGHPAAVFRFTVRVRLPSLVWSTLQPTAFAQGLDDGGDLVARDRSPASKPFRLG